jgi:small-conductance mechanosensitive channel
MHPWLYGKNVLMSGIDLIAILSSPAVITLARILVIIVLALLAIWALAVASRRIEKRIAKVDTDAQRKANLRTLVQVSRSVMVILVVVLATAEVLLVFNINVGPLLAGAGVAGLAISLGAQTLIKDFISGILILVEDQFRVGENISVGAMTGSVERVTLRTTHLRDWTGLLYIIPNGDIRALTNNSRDWALAVVDLNIGVDADLNRVIKALNEAAQRAREDAALKPLLLDDPQVQGWAGLSDTQVQVRVQARCLPANKDLVATELRRMASATLKTVLPVDSNDQAGA